MKGLAIAGLLLSVAFWMLWAVEILTIHFGCRRKFDLYQARRLRLWAQALSIATLVAWLWGV